MALFPRLCCLRLSSDFEGLGFSLIATKNDVGHFIGEVYENSPAAKSCLKNDDMIFEVNGKNVLNLSHAEVVELIRSNPEEVTFLVLDPEARTHYDSASIIVNGQMKEVVRLCSWEGGESKTVDLKNDVSTVDSSLHGDVECQGDKTPVKVILETNSDTVNTVVPGAKKTEPTITPAGDKPVPTVPKRRTARPSVEDAEVKNTTAVDSPPPSIFSKTANKRKGRAMMQTSFGEKAKAFNDL